MVITIYILLFVVPLIAETSPLRRSAVAFDAVKEATFDYVIVGGGLTGLVVANRLSEDGNSQFSKYGCTTANSSL